MNTRRSQFTKSEKTLNKSRLTLSWLKKHKVGYQEKLSTTPNQASPSCPLPISKDTAPRPQADEINRLAKVWCSTILGFIQERNRLAQIQGAIQE